MTHPLSFTGLPHAVAVPTAETKEMGKDHIPISQIQVQISA
jgi:hypothetical protein